MVSRPFFAAGGPHHLPQGGLQGVSSASVVPPPGVVPAYAWSAAAPSLSPVRPASFGGAYLLLRSEQAEHACHGVLPSGLLGCPHSLCCCALLAEGSGERHLASKILLAALALRGAIPVPLPACGYALLELLLRGTPCILVAVASASEHPMRSHHHVEDD